MYHLGPTPMHEVWGRKVGHNASGTKENETKRRALRAEGLRVHEIQPEPSKDESATHPRTEVGRSKLKKVASLIQRMP
jgi:hypothetical protein